MTVDKRDDSITLTCGTCGNAKLSLKKREVSARDWDDNGGWHELRKRATKAKWRISNSTSGDHYCPRCIAAYDF